VSLLRKEMKITTGDEEKLARIYVINNPVDMPMQVFFM